MKRQTTCYWVMIAVSMFMGVAAANGQSEVKEFNFDIAGRARLDLENLSGAVTITGWDQPRISVIVNKVANDSRSVAYMDMVHVDVRQRSDRIDIEVKYPSDSERRRRGVRNINISVNFEINVPHESDLDKIEQVSGDITVRDISGKLDISTVSGAIIGSNLGGGIELKSVSGDIRIENVHGEIESSTVSGDVVLTGVTGSVDAQNTSGNISVEAIDLEAMDADTTNGDIEMSTQSPLTFGDFSFKTLNGDIKLRIPEGSEFEISGKTGEGSISSAYDLTREDRRGRRMISGRVGEGGADITASTFNGDIIIRR